MEGRTRRKDHGLKGAYWSSEYANILRIERRSQIDGREMQEKECGGKWLESSRDCRDGINSKSVDQRVAMIVRWWSLWSTLQHLIRRDAEPRPVFSALPPR
jgi:hypothetical protein